MTNKRQFIKNLLLTAVPAGFATRALAVPLTEDDQNSMLAILASKFRVAGRDGTEGLYKPGKVPGYVQGGNIGVGYVGERIEKSLTSAVYTNTSSYADLPGLTVSLDPGNWLILFNAGTALESTSGKPYQDFRILNASDNEEIGQYLGYEVQTPGWYHSGVSISATLYNHSPKLIRVQHSVSGFGNGRSWVNRGTKLTIIRLS